MSFDFDPTLALFNSKRLLQEMGNFGVAGFGGCIFTETLTAHQSPIDGINHYYALHQVHGSELVHPRDPDQLTEIASPKKEILSSFSNDADGWFLSKETWLGSGIAFCIKTADCLPVLLFGSQNIGMLHAGWRGLQQGIILSALNYFKTIGDVPRYAALGPCADPALYEVGQEFVDIFPTSTQLSSRKIRTFDMYQEATRQLEEGGFRGALESSEIHTMSDTRLYSHRTSQQKHIQPQKTAILLPTSQTQNPRNYAVIGFLQSEDIPNTRG
jgi:copper oxidase (laccase) domain-containing protein